MQSRHWPWDQRLVLGTLFTVALSLASGCAGIEASRRSPGAFTKGEFAPTRPPAAQYGADPSKSCPGGGALPTLPDEVENRAKSSGRPGPKADGRLCAAAEALLGWNQPEVPGESVVAFISAYFGLPAPIPRITIAPLESEVPK